MFRPDVSSSDEHGLFALQAGDAVHRELADVVTAVGVALRKLWGGAVRTHSVNLTTGDIYNRTELRVLI